MKSRAQSGLSALAERGPACTGPPGRPISPGMGTHRPGLAARPHEPPPGLRSRVRSGPTLLLALTLAGWATPALAARQNEGDQIAEGEAAIEQTEQDSRLARSLGELLDVRLYRGSEFVVGSNFGEFRATSYQPAGRVKLTLPVAKNAALRVIARGSAMLYDFEDVSTTLLGTPTTSDPFGTL